AGRRSGLALAGLGLGLSALAGTAGPRSVMPLYDGVVPISPYVWLSPPPGAQGGAKGVSQTLPVSGGQNPIVAVHTPEQPPQAQLVAGPGTLAIGAGTTSITVSIEPVVPSPAPSDGQPAGNAYRVTLVDQAGVAVIPGPGTEVTLTLRGAPGLPVSWFEQSRNGSWRPLQSAQAGYPGTYETTGLDSFGDFVLVSRGASASPAPIDAVAIVAALGLLVLIVAALVVLVVTSARRRGSPRP
ncbi:MAG TPA: hypothetical protein VEY67_12445, partial [Candidatus Dormibacteraeota bacterium]|nr:hypothetical protein [Candidatus Dormibacteraeota bacterium]